MAQNYGACLPAGHSRRRTSGGEAVLKLSDLELRKKGSFKDQISFMNFPRSSGILLHPTSLPGPFGIGDLGPEAYAFADFLRDSDQSLWQVLPLGPTGYGDSPYACYSAFAGNTLLISPEQLFTEGLLLRAELPT